MASLKSSLKAASRILLGPNSTDPSESVETVIHAVIFDGEEDPFWLADEAFSTPFFTSETRFNSAIDSLLKCGAVSPVPTESGQPRTLCGNLSTNLYGTVHSLLTGAFEPWFNPFQLDEYGPNRQYVTQTLITFTDGSDEANFRTLSQVEYALNNQSDVNSITIGLSGEVDEAALRAIGREGYFPAANAAELETAFTNASNQVKDYANSFYNFQYCTAKRSGNIKVVLGAYDILMGLLDGSDPITPSEALTYSFQASSYLDTCPLPPSSGM